MIDQSSLMACPIGGYNSIIFAANVWNGNVFLPQGSAPYYDYQTGCNTVMQNSVPVYWTDNPYLPCVPGGSCTYGQTRHYGIRYSPATWGLCGPGNSYCINADRAIIEMNSNALTAGNILTRTTAIHELGHPVGLGDVQPPYTCNLQQLSIMNYDCVFNHNQQYPGSLDYTDIGVLY